MELELKDLEEMRAKFYINIKSMAENGHSRSEYFTWDRYKKILEEVKVAERLRENKESLSSMQYRRLKRFTVGDVDGVERLLENADRGTGVQRYYCSVEELFDVLYEAHLATGHRLTRATEYEVNKRWCNATRAAVAAFVRLCPLCADRRARPCARTARVNLGGRKEKVALVDLESPNADTLILDNVSQESVNVLNIDDASDEIDIIHNNLHIKMEVEMDDQSLHVDVDDEYKDNPANSFEDYAANQTDDNVANKNVDTAKQNLLVQMALSNFWREDDEFDLFGKTLIVQLKKMPLVEALSMQQDIQQIMNKYRIALHNRSPGSLDIKQYPTDSKSMPPNNVHDDNDNHLNKRKKRHNHT